VKIVKVKSKYNITFISS